MQKLRQNSNKFKLSRTSIANGGLIIFLLPCYYLTADALKDFGNYSALPCENLMRHSYAHFGSHFGSFDAGLPHASFDGLGFGLRHDLDGLFGCFCLQ